MDMFLKKPLIRFIFFTQLLICPMVVTAASVELLLNGDFDAGNVAWAEVSELLPLINSAADLPPGITPHSGNFAASFEGSIGTVDSISQSFFSPAEASSIELSAFVWIGNESTAERFDELIFRLDSADALTINGAVQSMGWVQYTLDITSLATPGAHTLHITAINDSLLPTSFFVDTVSITASIVPLPAAGYLFISAIIGLLTFRRKFNGQVKVAEE